uniref:Mitochondrial-processing peptidase subunit alpha n=2 Tax=Compsopogon caeruleus TaxID=31354 RepID=A0A7S1TIP5_9RHOD|mmetsp:Transcript_8033/g.16147  ORF Transcript_8033/g.16147 Transcript_8033/m.16147 type:complete len:507 (+) Transcript_8033:110-1630(+)
MQSPRLIFGPLYRQATLAPRLYARALAQVASPPLLWKAAHGFFDFEHSMIEPLQGIPAPVDVAASSPVEPIITVLPNGVRVSSQELGASVSSIGLLVAAGSRHEDPLTSGSSFLLERLAFKGSTLRSRHRMIRDMERSGGGFQASASRDMIFFHGDGLRENVRDVAGLVLEAAAKPAVSRSMFSDIDRDLVAGDLALMKPLISEELAEMKEDPSALLNELLHAAAFDGNSLGLPLIISPNRLEGLTPEWVAKFVADQFSADRMVVTGVNVEHEELVDITKALLQDIPAAAAAVATPSEYTGGELRTHQPGTAHVAMGLEGVSWNDVDLVPSAVLQTLLGGGGSFSSGGPGKGMYTRIFTHLLMRYPWIHHAAAFNNVYGDSGLFGIAASSEPDRLGDLARVVAEELSRMGRSLSDVEVSRAKNQTISSLLMNLESRAVLCEDVARQVLISGKVVSSAELVERIQAVKARDLERVASRFLATPVTLAMHGELFGTPSIRQVESIVRS